MVQGLPAWREGVSERSHAERSATASKAGTQWGFLNGELMVLEYTRRGIKAASSATAEGGVAPKAAVEANSGTSGVVRRGVGLAVAVIWDWADREVARE